MKIRITESQKREFVEVLVREEWRQNENISLTESALLLGYVKEDGKADIARMVPGAPTLDDLRESKWECDGGNRRYLIGLHRLFTEDFQSSKLGTRAKEIKKDNLREVITKKVETACCYLAKVGHNEKSCLICRHDRIKAEGLRLYLAGRWPSLELADKARCFHNSLNPANAETDAMIHRIIAWLEIVS